MRHTKTQHSWENRSSSAVKKNRSQRVMKIVTLPRVDFPAAQLQVSSHLDAVDRRSEEDRSQGLLILLIKPRFGTSKVPVPRCFSGQKKNLQRL